jgi:hypothetical protein
VKYRFTSPVTREICQDRSNNLPPIPHIRPTADVFLQKVFRQSFMMLVLR